MIRYSPMALNDLDEIYDYIKYELKNAEATRNTIDGILLKVDNIREFPEAGSKLLFLDNIDSCYRYFRYINYLAFYSINQKKRNFYWNDFYIAEETTWVCLWKREL